MEVPSDAPYSGEAWPQPEKNKAAMITLLDDYVGKILAKLQELKIDENTIVLVSSDNGPHKEGGVDPNFFHSSGPFRGYKRDLYEGGIRVPLLVHWPAKIKKPAVVDTPWAFWDFLPTAARDRPGQNTPGPEWDFISANIDGANPNKPPRLLVLGISRTWVPASTPDG